MKHVKIAYFDVLLNIYLFMWIYVLQAGRDTKFTVDQHDACTRFEAPQVILIYAAPSVFVLQPEHACMTLTNVEI